MNLNVLYWYQVTPIIKTNMQHELDDFLDVRAVEGWKAASRGADILGVVLVAMVIAMVVVALIAVQ